MINNINVDNFVDNYFGIDEACRYFKRCYETGKPFALLLPVSAIQGIKRGAMFNEHGKVVLILGSLRFCHGILPQELIFHGS